MNKKELEPLKPYVTLDEILLFDTDDEQTYTASREINAVCEAISKHKMLQLHEIAKSLQVDKRALEGAIEIATGLSFSEIRSAYFIKKMNTLRTEHPDYTKDKIAKALGFADRSALWRMTKRKNLK